MFEVLVFVYENYWRGEACPELAHLEVKLNAAGFEADEIEEALNWLDELHLAAARSPPVVAPTLATPTLQVTSRPRSMRIYTLDEQEHLGVQCLGFITFLEALGALSADTREIVIDRAMAAPADPLPLEDLKIIVLMVFWSLGQEPDALVLDELCDNAFCRVAH